jgi:hypothetical protein
MKETMSIETTAAGGALSALLKLFGVPVAAGTVATGLGFLIMWPKTRREGAVRFVCALAGSGIGGPFLVIAVHSAWPSLFASAAAVAAMYGLPPELGTLYVSAPFLVLAALPAWWILGGLVLWFERRRGKDLAELARDAAGDVKKVREAL